MNIFTIKISDITIPPDRQRTEKDDTYIDELSESIKTIGLINPIIVDETNTLIAGYCRIKAHQLLGRLEIPTRRWEDLSDYEKKLIEFEENVRRKNLSYNEQLVAELGLYELFQDHHGKKSSLYSHTSTARSKFNITDMAKYMGFSYGKMNERLRLAKAIRDDPKLGEFKTESQAKHALERQHVTAARTILAAVHAKEQRDALPSDAPKPQWETFVHKDVSLINADARQVIPTLGDETIGCLVTDPPWNVEFDSTFGSNPDEGFDITKDVLKLLYPKLQTGSICVMYCATRHLITGKVYNLVQSCGYLIYNTIHVWYKPKTAGSSTPYRALKNDYEPAILFSKGPARDFNQPMFAVIEHNIEGRTRYHKAQKSNVVLSQLIENFTVPNELVIDPFMGSAQTMIACLQTSRRGLGIELTKDAYGTAIVLIKEV